MSPPPFRFDLVWPQGRARLELPGAGDPDSDLDAARALAPALDAIAALECWIGTPLDDLRPASTPAPPAAAGFGWGEGGRLLLPPALLPWGKAPTAALPLAWPSWTVRVGLQSLPAARLPSRALVPGALLLLPASFAGEGWSVVLQPEPPLPARAGLWRPRSGRLDLAAADLPAAGPGEAGVWLDEAVAVDARAWFGADTGPLPLAAGAAVLHRAGQALARGTLLPAGLGWGLLIDDVAIAPALTRDDRAPAWT